MRQRRSILGRLRQLPRTLPAHDLLRSDRECVSRVFSEEAVLRRETALSFCSARRAAGGVLVGFGFSSHFVVLRRRAGCGNPRRSETGRTQPGGAPAQRGGPVARRLGTLPDNARAELRKVGYHLSQEWRGAHRVAGRSRV